MGSACKLIQFPTFDFFAPPYCISLADDACLLANTTYDLHNLLKLTLNYCEKYDVELVPEKIQLVAFHNSKMNDEVNFAPAQNGDDYMHPCTSHETLGDRKGFDAS